MQYRQKPEATLDDFITRARTQALKCDFSANELSERLLELIIASTQHEGFRKDLLGQEKGYSIADALKEGRQCEAITAGSQQAQDLDQHGAASVHVTKTKKVKPCMCCGGLHPKRKCPAYGDTCTYCRKENHWAKFCLSACKQKSKKQGEQNSKHKGGSSTP